MRVRTTCPAIEWDEDEFKPVLEAVTHKLKRGDFRGRQSCQAALAVLTILEEGGQLTASNVIGWLFEKQDIGRVGFRRDTWEKRIHTVIATLASDHPMAVTSL